MDTDADDKVVVPSNILIFIWYLRFWKKT